MTLGSLSLKVGEKTEPSQQIRRDSAKIVVKTAKKPVPRENCAPVVASNRSSNRGNPYLDDVRHLWTAEEQLAAASKGGKVKALRRAILDDCARTAAKENRIAKLFDDALNEPDPEIANQKMQLAERAAKFIGATHDQSDEAKQKIELAGKLDNNLNVHIEKV